MKLSVIDCCDIYFRNSIKNEFIDCDVLFIDAESNVNLPNSFYDSNYIIINRKYKITKSIIDRLKNCKAIIRNGIGYDNIDIISARQKNIDVYNVSDYCINEVADHTIALLLTYVRNIINYSNKYSLLNTKWGESKFESVRLSGKKIGIIGMGNIGKAVAFRAEAFGMVVSYYDPNIEKYRDYYRYQSINDLFQNSNVVSIHVPVNSSTKGFICNKTIGNCNDVILINTSRGLVINSNDVIYALKENRIKAFLTDVLENEPPLFDNPIIYECMSEKSTLKDRMLITPHIAYSSLESEQELIYKVVDIIKSLNCGNNVYSPVN